jgi:electron transfer flavoprotein alpha subunit
MEKILFLAHTEAEGVVGKASLEALTAAVKLAGGHSASTLIVGFIGQGARAAATKVGTCGAARFLAASAAAFSQPRYATDAAAAQAICAAAQPTIVLVPGTSRWNRVIAGVAHRAGAVADTHLNSVATEGQTVSVTRWYYRQRMEAAIKRAQRPWFLSIDPGSHFAWTGAAADAVIEEVPVILNESHVRTQVVGIRQVGVDAQTIRPEAKLLFVAGAGWTKKQADGQPHVMEAEQLILATLKNTRASLGSTKSLVDIGGEGQVVLSFLTHLNQVGQTGSTPRHPKGLATCCHGEEPHTVGWRFINERRAVNLDPNCGWARGKADVLYVADAFAVMKAVNERFEDSST